MEILDCTIRDGGYYTNWDFDVETVKIYLDSINNLPLDYIEVGYRNPIQSDYYGEYYFLPPRTLKFINDNTTKKIAIILNEKDISEEMISDLLTPCIKSVSLVRMAVDPVNFSRALKTARTIKRMGFDVAFNVMYLSTWKDHPKMINCLEDLDGVVDYFYLVDSFGAVYPDYVKEIIHLVRSKTKIKIGFHGHNNLELALANTLTAIENGIDIIDATFTGMGRGAGNLKTELLLTVLNKKNGLDVDFNSLSNVTSEFSRIQDKYKWGTSLPYMVSGANSLPQKQVMDWVSKRIYSLNSIVRALSNQSKKIKDNNKFSVFKPELKFKKILIIGGGYSAIKHKEAILSFLAKNEKDLCIIHASSKNALAYKPANNKQYFCLLGNEGIRLEKVFSNTLEFKGDCVLPPYPRKMGTYVPSSVKTNTYELEEVEFTNLVEDSHTAIAIQTALNLGGSKIYLAGYDGYSGLSIAKKDQELFLENSKLFIDVSLRLDLTFIVPSNYNNILSESVYSLI